MEKNIIAKNTKWSIDQSHSEIAFKVRHMMISHVKGTFKKFDASIYTTGKDFSTAEIDLWIDVASINTGDVKRDEHLQGVDFFDTNNHKQITFTSATFGKADAEGNHELWGELTMRGVTKNVKLIAKFGGFVKDPWGNERAGFSVAGKFNRSDWDLVWNSALEAGGLMVSDEVAVSCDVELISSTENDLTMELVGAADEKTSV